MFQAKKTVFMKAKKEEKAWHMFIWRNEKKKKIREMERRPGREGPANSLGFPHPTHFV